MRRTTTLPCAVCETPIAPDDMTCPQCGAVFAWSPPPTPETYLETVAIAEYNIQPEAELARGLLAEAGIESILTDTPDNALNYAWGGRNKILRVREDRAESAVALLKVAPEDVQLAAAAESASPSDIMPRTVKGYSGAGMKTIILAGLTYLILSLWQWIVCIYAVLGIRKLFSRRSNDAP